jgi:hypothetical protein
MAVREEMWRIEEHYDDLADYQPEVEENTVFFNIKLVSTQTKETEDIIIAFPQLPEKILHIKERVEEQFSVSVCLQTLLFENYPMSNNCTLEKAKIRSEDKFVIEYTSKTDLLDINHIILWFEAMQKYFQVQYPSVSSPVKYYFEQLVTLAKRDGVYDKMVLQFLRPWQNKRTYANKIHFVYVGGLDEMMDAYATINAQKWKFMILDIKFMEHGILRILWSLSETFQLRREILRRNNGLSLCMKSFLREQVEAGKPIVEPTKTLHHAYSWIIVQNIGTALGLLSW